MKKKFFKYVFSFVKSFTLFLIIIVIGGKFIGFTTFYIEPLSWAELFGDYLNVLIVLPSVFGVVGVYLQWEKDNKK